VFDGRCSKHYPKSYLKETNNVIIDHDEIRNFIEIRYVGPVEACWHILEKTKIKVIL